MPWMSYDENGGNAGSNGNSGAVRFPPLTLLVRGIRNTFGADSIYGTSSMAFRIVLAATKNHMNGVLRLDQATIVLVEDDPNSRESLTMLLESEGARVVAVADAEEGVETAMRLLPDAIICDIDLPAMDGFYLIQRLRDYEIRGDHVPSVAIAITGHTEDTYRLRSIGEGFQHFMTKPAQPEQLVSLLREAIGVRAAG
jgi:CheY-like chemotaxis protein